MPKIIRRGSIHGEQVFLDQKEWKILLSVKRAWTIRELARLSNIPYSTIIKVLERLRKIVQFKFQIKLREVGLIPLHVFLKSSPGEPPPFTLYKTTLTGTRSYVLLVALVPVQLLDKYLEELYEEPLIVVKGYELHYWKPDPAFNEYTGETLKPRYGFYKDPAVYAAPVEPFTGAPRPPDKIDLMIISIKMADPFMRPGKIARHASLLDPSLPSLSSQALSYHTVHHVKERYWEGNATCLCFGRSWKVPRRVFYLEGPRAPLAARMLVNLPGFSYAAVDVDRAVVAGYPLCSYFEHIYRFLGSLGVDMPLGDLVDPVGSREVYVPMLWRATEKRRWVWPEDPPRRAAGTVFEGREFF